MLKEILLAPCPLYVVFAVVFASGVIFAALLPVACRIALKRFGEPERGSECESEREPKRGLETEDKRYEILIAKRQAEYMALQNQINPHFLYNTLEAIRGDALNEGVVRIAEMTEALATFFRYTISNAENLVTLEDELSNVESYFIIQQYRFGDRINLSVYYDKHDPNVLSYMLPKLTLQPIIENAIYHGLECKMDAGNIKIKIETTRARLLINIVDDGVGIGEEALGELQRRLNRYGSDEESRKGGIALVNVNNRIRLLFGDEYGLRVSSVPGYGTDMEIVLPLKKDKKL